MSATQPNQNKKKNTFDFIAKKRHAVYTAPHRYTKDEVLACLAEILIETYLKKKRYEKTK